MATDVEQIAIGAEGKVNLGGQEWCYTDLSMQVEKTQVEVTSSCDYVQDKNMVYGASRTVKKRYTGSLTINLDKTKDPRPAFDSNDDNVAGYIEIYDGLRYTGIWQIGQLGFQGGGSDNVWQVTVPFASQGPVEES